MTFEELKLQRLSGQHLLMTDSTEQIAKDLCGVQAQFLSHALHGLTIRSTHLDTTNLCKTWSIRGTMHLFSLVDLPLFLHEGRDHFLRPVDTMESDAYLSATRKKYFANVILDAISTGTELREELKEICAAQGMTDSEEISIFNPWGGLLRALCEEGRICHKVQERKAFQLCPEFQPMDKTAAQTELARRYFNNFGPATIKDAATFFHWPQATVKTILKNLPVESFLLKEKAYFYIPRVCPAVEVPNCIFLAGFDQLLLGYEKTQNPFLPQSHIRDIYTRAGIVRQTVLLNGAVSGIWKINNEKLAIQLFADADRECICEAAKMLWPELTSIHFE